MSTISGPALAKHFRSLGCRVDEKSLDFNVHALSHIEDAQPGTLSWHRKGTIPFDFCGDVIVSRSDMTADGAAHMVAYHENPRMVLRETIEKLGLQGEGYGRVAKGRGCKLHPSAVIGAEGQSYDRVNGRWIPFPHAGGVRIEDEVHVGPCATIMAGSIGDTVIGSGSRIGNGVNIGHDTRIGRDVLVIAGALIAGWVRIGNGAKIWQGAAIKNGIHIGEGAEIGMGSVVLEDVPAMQMWAGNPAKKIK